MNFDNAFDYVIGREGSLSMDPDDPGNWTGGSVGAGELKGTKYGISAAAYPLLDIAAITIADARAVAKRDYWDKLAGDVLPYGTALCLFDFGYNAGIRTSVRAAQRALGLQDDGIQGPLTHAALMGTPVPIFASRFTAERLKEYSMMPWYSKYGAGWVARAKETYSKAVASC